MITKGFGDLLRIGTQARPDLFALQIKRPELLYERVFEAEQRLDASVVVITNIAEAPVAEALRAAKADGIEAVAIAFLHAHVTPDHEVRAAELARRWVHPSEHQSRGVPPRQARGPGRHHSDRRLSVTDPPA